jgi:hypothetical protein
MRLRTATPGVPPAVNVRAILERSAKWKAGAADLTFETTETLWSGAA